MCWREAHDSIAAILIKLKEIDRWLVFSEGNCLIWAWEKETRISWGKSLSQLPAEPTFSLLLWHSRKKGGLIVSFAHYKLQSYVTKLHVVIVFT